MRTLFLLVAVTLHVAGNSAAAQYVTTEKAIVGRWKEKTGDSVYAFKPKHDFEYQHLNSSLVPVTEAGAWQIAREICSIPATGQKGNVMIHLGTTRCCHMAQFLGSNLVLSSLTGATYGVCADRVLVRDQ